MQNYFVNKQKHSVFLILLFLWSILLFYMAKDEILGFVLPGKLFSGRSFLIQAIIATSISMFIFVFLLSLFFLLPRLSSLLHFSECLGNKYFVWVDEYIRILFAPIFQFTIMLWIIAFSYIPRGFDITDNGYYLLIAHRFEDVAYEIRQFGLFTRLIYLAAGESTGLMRVYGAIILFGISLVCGWTITKVSKTNSIQEKALYLALSTIPTLMFYRQWISTPNYNWLALISGLILIIGLMVVLGDLPKRFLGGGIFIGSAIFLAFFAKPSTAACFIGVIIFFLVIEHKKITNLIEVMIGGLISLICGVVLIYLSGQTVPVYFDKFVRGYQAISLFEHSLNQIFSPMWIYFELLFIYYWWIWVGFFVLILGLILLFRNISIFKNVNIEQILVIIWSTSLLALAKFLDTGIWAGFLYGLTFEFILLILLTNRKIAVDKGFTSKSILRSLYILLIAFSIAFGSIDGYMWHFANIVCVFVISQIFLLECLPKYMVRKSQLGLAIILLIAVPYVIFFKPTLSWKPTIFGQDIEVWKMEEQVSIRYGKETVVTSPKYAMVFSKLQNDALANGFVAGTPIIDLSGASPGLVYVLDGRSPIYPWYAGGYPNSEKFVRNILNEWPDTDLMKAWILTSDGTRQIPVSVLNEQGLKFSDQFKKVSSVRVPYNEGITVYLWKPKLD